DAKVARYDQLDDVVGTVTAAFLGQTIRCARCHDHKFEPYTQQEYYRLLAVFDPLSGKNSDAIHVGTPAELAAYPAAHAAIDAQITPLEEQRDAVLLAILQEHYLGPDGTPKPASRQAGQRPLSSSAVAALRKPPGERTKQDRDAIRRSRQRIEDYARPLAQP